MSIFPLPRSKLSKIKVFFPFDNRMTCDFFLSKLKECDTNLRFSSQTTQMLPFFAGCLRLLEIICRLQDKANIDWKK